MYTNTKLEISSLEIESNEIGINPYSDKEQIITNFREETQLEHRPPKKTLSDLVFNNKLSELRKQLEKGIVDLNERDNLGTTCSWTPLYWSVKLKRIECMKLLLQYGSNINLVINDYDECCGTVLDLATIRGDEHIEFILREFAEKEDVNLGQSFKAIRTKLRGKAPAFNFRYYGKNKKEDNINPNINPQQ
jgi:hypothetical protein